MYGALYFSLGYFAAGIGYTFNSPYKYVSDSGFGTDSIVVVNNTPPLINVYPQVKLVRPW